MEKYEDEKSKIIRESIGEAILKLLNEKNFSGISVCDICTLAGVGRTTYYRYYGDKYGKEDAIYNWFVNRWNAHMEHSELCPDILNEKDELFRQFIFDSKNTLLLLKEHSLLPIWDNFVLYVYGPTEPADTCPGDYYYKYSGAGIWIGLSRAIIERGFQENLEEVKSLFLQSMIKSFSGSHLFEPDIPKIG